MSDDLIAAIGRLIDGDMDRRERLALLAALAARSDVRDLLTEAIRLDLDMAGLAEAYGRTAPDGISPAGVLAAIDGATGGKAAGPGALSRAVDSVRDALRQMTLMGDDDLRMAMGGNAPPPGFDQEPVDDVEPWDAAVPLRPDSLPSARPPDVDGMAGSTPRFQLVEGTGGILDFRQGAGSLRVAATVATVDLGPVGPREQGGWVLRLIAGEARQTGTDRVDIAGNPEVGGCLILLDGSSLLFTAPLSIRWQPAAEDSP